MKKEKAVMRAYIAGIVDGEGCICILPIKNYKKKNNYGRDFYYRMRVAVKMADGNVIDYLVGNYGGYVYERKKPGGNRVCQYSWWICGSNAVKMLKEIMPFLICKKKQAELAISFQEAKRQGKKVTVDKDEWSYHKMKELHKYHYPCAVVENKRSNAERRSDVPSQSE